MKPANHKAWFLVAPVLLLVAISAIIPLMTVVNYSVQYVGSTGKFAWVGDEWYREVLHSEKFWNALWRNLVFSGVILAIQIPLGVLIALNMPRKGWGVPVCLVLMALPLLIPWYVVGMIWQMFGRVDIGLMGVMLRDFGYNYEGDPMDAWFTLILMDVWHWTSLVALLAYAGLVSIPDAYYQAARIDGASKWAVFRFIQLPRLARVLTIAILLRFMDSFMIFTEPFAVIAGGDPVFLSTELKQTVELGKKAAMSIIYFLIILAVSWVFYAVMTRNDGEPTSADKARGGGA
jgi:glycerol transport system permease protein